MNNLNYSGPVVLAILDGVGLSQNKEGNAVLKARTEFLDEAIKKHRTMALEASGEAVGIMPGQMGNSEVGHNAIGAGQIIKQGIAKIEEEFKTGKIWKSSAWQGIIETIRRNNSTLHFAGIFSDGGVHSSIDHLFKLITQANKEGVEKIRIHLVLDGRDVAPQSAEKYIDSLEKFLTTFTTMDGEKCDYKIASGGGRMVYVADRYETDWTIVERGWNAIVRGQADDKFLTAKEAILKNRQKNPELQDQYIPTFIIEENGEPVGRVKDGDSFIYYDFRADRALEIAQAFTYEDFAPFYRGTENNRRLNVFFAGMTEYNSNTHVPEHRLVEPVKIENTLHDFLGENNISQLAISETAKFGHITYYFNGNSYAKYYNEEQIEIKSDTRPYNERPWMKSAEITDVVLDKMKNYKFVRINFPGGDMVGHFGELESTIVSIEAIDLQLRRIAKKVDELDGMLLIISDHGNAEELINEEGETKTSHTTNLVPCIFYDNTENKKRYELNRFSDAGLTNIAPTLANLLGFSDLPKTWRESLIKIV